MRIRLTAMLCLLFAAIFIVLTFSACGGKAEKSPAETTSVSSSAAPAKTEEKSSSPYETTSRPAGLPSAISFITPDGKVTATSDTDTLIKIVETVKKFKPASKPASPGASLGRVSISYPGAAVIFECHNNGVYQCSGKWFTLEAADAKALDDMIKSF